MKSTFNTAAFAHLTLSELYKLLTHYRRYLNKAGISERPHIVASIAAIQSAIARRSGPG